MEFRNSIDTTGVNIPARIVDYVLEEAQRTPSQAPLSAQPLVLGS
jgi:hypothetical protein